MKGQTLEPNSNKRAYCFTINNYTDSDIDGLMDLPVDYLLFSFEEGKEGTPHIQGYVYHRNKILFSKLKKFMPRSYIDLAKGTFEQNYTYIVGPYSDKKGKKKPFNPDHYEFGEKPHQGTLGKERIENIMKNPYENFHLYNQYRKAYKELQNSERKDHDRKLYVIKQESKYEYAKKCQKKVTFDYTLETYEDEDVVFCSCYGADWVMDWVNGFPRKVKRGYEIITCDPEAVYIMYSDIKEYNYLIKKYDVYLDNVA